MSSEECHRWSLFNTHIPWYILFLNQMENNLKSSNTVNHKRMLQVKPVQYVHVILKSNGRITSSPLIYPVSTYAILYFGIWYAIQDTNKLGLLLKAVSFTSYIKSKNQLRKISAALGLLKLYGFYSQDLTYP